MLIRYLLILPDIYNSRVDTHLCFPFVLTRALDRLQPLKQSWEIFSQLFKSGFPLVTTPKSPVPTARGQLIKFFLTVKV